MEDFSIYSYMKPGIVHFKAFPEVARGEGPYVETLKKIAEDDFFTAVEVGMVKDVKVRNEARKLLEVSHLEVCYATQPKVLTNKLNINSLDKKEREKAVDAIKSCIDEAMDLGASWVRLISGKDPGDDKRDEAKKVIIDSIKELCEYAAEQGDLKLTLKIFDRDIDKCALIGHFKDARDVAVEVYKERKNFGLLADLSHFPLLDEKPEDAIPIIKDFPLLHFHIGNCLFRDRRHPAYGDLQPRFGIPGGEIDTPQVRDYFRLLKNLGLIGQEKKPVVSAEVRPLLAEEYSEIIIANAKRVIKEAWAEV
ncbi:MAG: sugar phosphate isomerase/epimerase [Spirochaetes bacterium]|nr:MAG: sugar phosphate isomerase/epimerase [Spirochaetota bacterium]